MYSQKLSMGKPLSVRVVIFQLLLGHPLHWEMEFAFQKSLSNRRALWRESEDCRSQVSFPVLCTDCKLRSGNWPDLAVLSNVEEFLFYCLCTSSMPFCTGLFYTLCLETVHLPCFKKTQSITVSNSLNMEGWLISNLDTSLRLRAWNGFHLKAVRLQLLILNAGRITLSGCVSAAQKVHQSAKETDFPLRSRTEVWRASSSYPANSISCWNHWCGSVWGLELHFWTK